MPGASLLYSGRPNRPDYVVNPAAAGMWITARDVDNSGLLMSVSLAAASALATLDT